MRLVSITLGVFALSGILGATNLQIQITSSVPSPQPVGSEVVFTFAATDTNPNPGTLNFRFEVAPPQSAVFTMIRDFEVSTTFKWARGMYEGNYQIRVTARDTNYLTDTPQLVIPFKMTTRLTGSQPVVNATTHPLVALFSAPVCLVGKSMRVVYQVSGSPVSPFNTNFVACNGKTSMNFLIGGMIAGATYSMYSQLGIPNGVLQNGAVVTWTAGTVPSTVLLLPLHFLVPFGPAASQPERLSIFSFNANSTQYAANAAGKVIWYYAGDGAYTPSAAASVQLMRLMTGGFQLTSVSYPGSYTGIGVFGNQLRQQAIQVIDLTGHVVQETNVDRVNEQLLAMGTDPITSFNHDARLLPNGHIIVIGSTQKIFPAGTQGSSVPVDILGNSLVELDKNFQVVWFWDAFDHAGGGGQLDINRADPLNEVCTPPLEGTNGCPPTLLASPAPDWLHANTLQYMPADGSLLVSFRNQDLIGKIDYNNGAGSGNILWLMGEGGSFAINNPTADPWPWFSHQHDIEFQYNSNQLMTIYDNGNTRIFNNGGNSRGYVLNVNESGLQVTPILLADLGYYAVAQGSAQVLSNGDYEFLGGQIVGAAPHDSTLNGLPPTPSYYEEGSEVTPSGSIVYSEDMQSPAYRLWRVTDLYNVPTN